MFKKILAAAVLAITLIVSTTPVWAADSMNGYTIMQHDGHGDDGHGGGHGGGC